tara:strand:- start:1976 stop:2554 length:579 start_codon:yes stop_codon:yes gene_type:complete
MKEILLIGGGGHCKSVIDVIESHGQFEIVGIVDKTELLGSDVLGYPVIGNDLELERLSKVCANAIVTIGQIRSPDLRINLFSLALKAGFSLPIIVSPRAYVSKHAIIGRGTVIMHDALVNSDSSIGENCIVNTKALIEHDCKISDHCHISTGAFINGQSTIGRGSFIGSGAITKQSTIIGNNSFVKAGSVIK